MPAFGTVCGQLLQRKIALRLGLDFGLKLGLGLGLGRQFSSGEIVLEPFRAMSFSRIFIFVNSAAVKNTIPG